MQHRQLGPDEIAEALARYVGEKENLGDSDMAVQIGRVEGRPAALVTWQEREPRQAKAGPESQAQEPEGLAEDEMLRSVGIDPGQ